MNWLNRYLLEPMSTLTHLVATIASVGGMVYLVQLTRTDPPKMVSLLIYGLSMVVMYLASTLLHGLKLDDEKRMWLNRFDHAAIFLVIAGTYTPITYNIFTDGWRWLLLGGIWIIAFMGVIYKLASVKIHGFLNVSIYLFLAWGTAIPLIWSSDFLNLIPIGGLWLILLGGLIYTGGFVIYYTECLDPWPDVFGHHEVWHVCVMGGSVCHFLFMLLYVVPFERVMIVPSYVT